MGVILSPRAVNTSSIAKRGNSVGVHETMVDGTLGRQTFPQEQHSSHVLGYQLSGPLGIERDKIFIF